MVGGFNREFGRLSHELVGPCLQSYVSGTIPFTYLTIYKIVLECY
jgi:hypothetical protein